jgi:hypothetical protein
VTRYALWGLLLTITAQGGQQPPVRPPSDRKIGTATFHLQAANGAMVAEPLLPTQFRLRLLKGELKEPHDIVHCGVFARDIGQFTLTVLKCGENEYAVEEVDFTYDK